MYIVFSTLRLRCICLIGQSLLRTPFLTSPRPIVSVS